jgi:hypothetical protein
VRYVDNATQLWSNLGSVSATEPGYMRFETPALSRVILLEARQRVEDLLVPGEGGRVSLEDSFGTSEPPDLEEILTFRMPVMERPAGPVQEVQGIEVTRVADADELAEAEQVIVHGFPQRVYQPLSRGSRTVLLAGPAGWPAATARRPRPDSPMTTASRWGSTGWRLCRSIAPTGWAAPS